MLALNLGVRRVVWMALRPPRAPALFGQWVQATRRNRHVHHPDLSTVLPCAVVLVTFPKDSLSWARKWSSPKQQALRWQLTILLPRRGPLGYLGLICFCPLLKKEKCSLNTVFPRIQRVFLFSLQKEAIIREKAIFSNTSHSRSCPKYTIKLQN